MLILSIAITGPLTIASRGLESSLQTKNQIIAYSLAQDAIEYVRFVRDTNKLNSRSWLTNLSNCTSSDGSKACYLDSTEQNPISPGLCISGCGVLYYNSATGFYNYATGVGQTQSPFIRTIQIYTPYNGTAGVGGADEAVIVVNVAWFDGGLQNHSISLQESIFNWR